MNALTILFKNPNVNKLVLLIALSTSMLFLTINLQASPNSMKIATQATLVGKVFHDENGNGYQDIFEQGIAGTRLATVTGLIIQTDGQGRYNVPDSIGETISWGQNFIIKLDPASLPRGAEITTENPRVVRFSNSGLNKINFGVRLP